MPAKGKQYWTPKRIRELRLRLGLTQREAAERIGASTITWRQWESGMRNPNTWASRLLSDWLQLA